MAVTAHWFGRAAANMLGGETLGEASAIDYLSDTIKVALLDNTFTPDLDTQEFFADVSADEVVGAGYVAGGATLTGKAISYDPATNTVKFDADDPEWNPSTITARYAVVYKSTGTGSTSPLLSIVDFGVDQSTLGGAFTIAWSGAGMLEAVAS